jgi:hypothetical protein
LGLSPVGHVADIGPKDQRIENLEEVQMPRDRLESHGYVEQMLGPFSALFPNRPWKSTKARRNYIDIFGITIENGETYYREQGGKRRKLSRLSMERVMRIIFDSEAVLELGKELFEKELERLKQAHAKYSPVAVLHRQGRL